MRLTARLPKKLHPAPRPSRPRLEELEDRVVPSLLGNQLFPADNPWNEKITNAPVAANSATLVAGIGLTADLHPDFGTTYAGALNGIPYNVVHGNTQPQVSVVIDAYPGESDLLPIPIPAGAVIEGDPLPSAQNTGDRHLIVYDQDNNVVYETFNTHKPSETADGRWHADAEAVWNLSQDTFRTAGYTSADAAGLPILPGLVRDDEVLDQGVITHALRFTVARTDNNYVYPASHQAGVANPNLPRMGERFRLKQSFDISGFSPANRVILQALKDYGMIVADNGSNWYLSGAPSARWNDSDLHQLGTIPGSAFEAVDLTPVVSGLSQAGGSANGGDFVTVSGVNFSGGAGRTQVFFGGVPAASVQVVSDGQIIAVAPAHAAGAVDVTVQSPYGTSAPTPADGYTYTPPAPPQGLLEFAAGWFSVSEAGGSAAITVSRVGGSTGTVTIHYATANGTALAGSDYTPASGTLTFAAGQTSATFTIPVFDDGVIAGGKTVVLTLSLPTGGAGLGAPASAVLTIKDAEGSPTQRFVAQVYLDLLQRPVDPGGLAAWTGLLAGGMARSQVVQAVAASVEYRSVVTQGLYRKFLGRAADPTGLAGGVALLGGGGTAEQLEAAILGSAEYLARSGGTNQAFLAALYLGVLGRPLDAAAAQGWGAYLAAGASRTAVAQAVVTSAESLADEVQGWYAALLHRPADAGSQNAFVQAMQRGMRDEQVLAILAGSDEYFANV